MPLSREELEKLAWRVVTEELRTRTTNGERAEYLADVFSEVQKCARRPEGSATDPACELCGDQENLILLSRCHYTAPLQLIREGDVLIARCYLPDCNREVARFRIDGGGQ